MMTPEDVRRMYESKPQQPIDPETLAWLKREIAREDREGNGKD